MWLSPLHCFEWNLTSRMLIFMTFQKCKYFLIWKCILDPEDITLNIITTSDHYLLLFSSLFPVLLWLSFGIASLSIFGNVHRPCNPCCNIANNRLNYVYSFLPFLLIFWLYFQKLLYWEMRTDHVNGTLMFSTTVNTMSIPFFICFVCLLGYIVLVTIFRNVHRPCQHYSKTFNNSLDYVYSFVPCLFWFSSYDIWKCAQTMSMAPLHC